MSEAKHTHGPWEVGEKFALNSLFPDDKDVTKIIWIEPEQEPCSACGNPRKKTKLERTFLVAHLFDGSLPGLKKAAKANARLIAAAPAFAKAWSLVPQEIQQRIFDALHTPETEWVEAAIAKATT